MLRSTTRSQAVFGLALLLLSLPALAGSFGVSPVRLTLTAGQPAGVLTVRNRSDTETVVQLQANAWSQQEGAEVLEPSSDLVAVPPLFTLPPHGSQIVRVGLRRAPSSDRELTYRLLLREVPPPPEDDFTGLQVALQISLPVFVVPPRGAEPLLEWSLGRGANGAVRLSLHNRGSAHVQIRRITLSGGPDGAPAQEWTVPAYVLAGQRRDWRLNRPISGGTWTLNADTDAGDIEAELEWATP